MSLKNPVNIISHGRLGRAVRFAAVLSIAASTPLAAQASHPGHQTTSYKTPTAAPRKGGGVPLLNNLGSWSRKGVATVPLAQRYFDQGLRLYYGFNHAESVRSFREAQRLDPTCVMCVWGEAAALGPNINAPMDTASERQAIDAATRAVALLRSSKVPARVQERHSAWINAIADRYLGNGSRAKKDSAFARAMAAIADANPNDADALAIAAEAAMDLSPWAYWEKDGAPRDGTLRLVSWLERAMTVADYHPGACHFYIHAVEAAYPARAVKCAERLAAMMPGAGHIVHMPAHIYIRVGRWADAIAMNKHAVHADEKYFEGPHTTETGLYAAMYQSHNFHFLTLAAVMAGSSATAFEASRKVVDIVTPDVVRSASVFEPLLAVPVQTLVTFGRWDEILKTPLPPSDLRVALGHFWYARGIAFAATGRHAEARATIDSIQAVRAKLPEGETRMTMDIAALMVAGEIAFRSSQHDRASKLYAEAAAIEDALSYMEPPTWYHPVRHSWGRALLAAGRAQEAEQLYHADLRRFPENGWSLMGLSKALAQQGLVDASKAIEKRFRKAWRLSDVSITDSRY